MSMRSAGKRRQPNRGALLRSFMPLSSRRILPLSVGIISVLLGAMPTHGAVAVISTDGKLTASGKNYDDICFWRDPTNADGSLAFITSKDGRMMEAFNLGTGRLVGTIRGPGAGFAKPNNCDVTGDVLLMTDDEGERVFVYGNVTRPAGGERGVRGGAGGVADYSLDHDAFAYFNDVTGNPPDRTNAYCIQHIRPYSEFAADLQTGSVARYNFIIPNDQHQGEKHASAGSSLVAQADGWLAREVPAILASPAYQDGGVVLIVWDESRTHGVNAPIGCIVVSPFAKRGYANTIAYSHGSTLRTVQEIFGGTPFLGKAAAATDLSDLFTVFP